MNRIIILISSYFIFVGNLLAQNASVAAAHPLAVDVVESILKKGGNAYDAAVAAHFSLAVVLPRAGNIGGGGFAVIHTSNAKAATLDYREVAPLSASKDMFVRDENNNNISSLTSKSASGVPGSVMGMWNLYLRYGSRNLSWSDLLTPAITLADTGFFITEKLSEELNYNSSYFILQNPNGCGPFCEDVIWEQGIRLVQSELAETLKGIADYGPNYFYSGPVAKKLVEQNYFTMSDMASYLIRWREPIIGEYRGWEVITMPPPSSGGVALLQLLYGSERDLNTMQELESVASYHDFTELTRIVYEDRARYLGDPDYMDMRTADLLDTSYLDKRFMSIDPKRAGKSPNLAVPLGEESSETTHFSILDKEGNSIAITTTLNASYGSKRWVSGFFMNNEMDDFSISPGVPNQFGLIGFEANSIEPGKRMLSSMTPTILVKGDQKVVLGTPGGSTIITNVFQVIRRFCRFGQTLQESVNSKKIHAQAWPEVLYLEEGSFTKKVLRKLKKKGHKIEFKKQIGRFQAVSNGKTAPDVLRTGDSAGRVILIE
tara:strand:- start:2968 stop:4602 length:1635 start_codon:yes stop_codon:yes gene_type:complete